MQRNPELFIAFATSTRPGRLSPSLARTGIREAFALGVSTVLLALSHGAQAQTAKRRNAMMTLAARSKLIMGGVFVLIGAAIWFRLHIAPTNPAWLKPQCARARALAVPRRSTLITLAGESALVRITASTREAEIKAPFDRALIA